MYCKIACLHVDLYSEPSQHLYHYINVGVETVSKSQVTLFFGGIFQSYIYNHINFWTNSSIHNIFIQILNIHFRKWSCHLKKGPIRGFSMFVFRDSTNRPFQPREVWQHQHPGFSYPIAWRPRDGDGAGWLLLLVQGVPKKSEGQTC